MKPPLKNTESHALIPKNIKEKKESAFRSEASQNVRALQLNKKSVSMMQ